MWRSPSWSRSVASDYNVALKMRLGSIGRQHLGALFNVIAYYILALPLGITMAIHPKFDLGLQGLWIGKRLKNLSIIVSELRLAFRSSCRLVHCWYRRVLDGLAWD